MKPAGCTKSLLAAPMHTMMHDTWLSGHVRVLLLQGGKFVQEARSFITHVKRACSVLAVRSASRQSVLLVATNTLLTPTLHACLV